MSKIHILAFGAHPDDVELSACGTLMKHLAKGDQVAIADLTMGELGTRGSAKTREEETKKASEIMKVKHRENLGFKDGFFQNDESHRMQVIKIIRKYCPEIVLCNAILDRHPDHGRAASLVSDACFLSGLIKIKTSGDKGEDQKPWKPRSVYHYIQDRYIQPAFLVDISGYMDKKLEAIRAYTSQFHDPESAEPETYISTPAFLDAIKNRAAEFGRLLGVKHAEGFTCTKLIGVDSLNDLL